MLGDVLAPSTRSLRSGSACGLDGAPRAADWQASRGSDQVHESCVECKNWGPKSALRDL
jgi:hypothetical protein